MGRCEEWQDEAVAVPEDMASVARPGQSASADRSLAGIAHGADQVEEREPDRELQLRVAFDHDVRAVPSRRPPRAVIREEALEADALCFGEPLDGVAVRRCERAEPLEAIAVANVCNRGGDRLLRERSASCAWQQRTVCPGT